MAQDATQIYPLNAGMLSGTTAGGFSPAVAMGFGGAAVTPTTSAAGLSPSNRVGMSGNGLAFILWSVGFLAAGLFLLHLGAER